MSTPGAIIFDLDGTLIDSAPDIAAAVNQYLVAEGWPEQDTKLIERFVGYGPHRLLADLFAEIGLAADKAKLEQAHKIYLENYHAEPADRTRLYPHVREDLAHLAAAGFRLGICTNKPHKLTLRVLEVLGLDKHFCAVVGADATPHCKPDPRHLLEVVDRIGLDRSQCSYVGDTVVDLRAANAADLTFYVVPWGGGSGVNVLPEQRLERLSDLLRATAETGGAL